MKSYDNMVNICGNRVELEEEKVSLLALGTGEKLEYDRSKTFVDLFIEQAGKTSNNIAVVDKDSRITYKELDEQSNAIANRLIEEYNIRPNDFVAVMLPRKKEFVTSVIGILKAGAAYVPIEESLPEQRRSYILSDCGSKTIVTQEWLTILGKCFNTSESVPVNNSTTDGPAYVIYTSGSTGLPKGTIVGNKAFSSFTAWANKCFNQRDGSKHLVHASFSFDISIIEMLCPLSVGGEVHILSEDARMDIASIAGYINEKGINGATFPTSVGMILLNSCDLNLEYAVLAGEKMYPVREQKIRVFNDYGPCEFGIGSTLYEIRGGETEIPIGRPVPNCSAKICDAEGCLIPRGQIGELYLSGVQLGLGYINRSELNKEKYVNGWYRTGDLVRWNEEGQLEYIGRIDNQIKLKGFRIELGEIESSAIKVSGVSQAVASARNEVLYLYYTGEATKEDIRAELSKTLAEYMVPGIFIHLDAMPLTPNGKIDRSALPEPEIQDEGLVLPETATEQRVFEIIAQALKTERFGVTTNLVSVGMTSIAAMRLAMSLKQNFGISVKMTGIMFHPTVRELAELIYSASRVDDRYGIEHPYQEYYPLTENQKGVYIDWMVHKEGLQYNVPFALKLKNVNAERIAEAIRRVINAHPILKMRLSHEVGEVMQRRDDSLVPEVTVAKLPQLSENGIQSFFQSRVRPFDLFHDTLYRFEIYTSKDSTYLFKDIHHIVTDGLSEGMLMEEIHLAYEGMNIEKEVYTFYDYSLETTSSEEDENYFKGLIGDTQATVYPKSRAVSGEGKTRMISIDMAKSAIEEQRSKQGVTASNYILHSLMQVLRSITREERVLITAVSNGRSQSCMQTCQGFFVKTLPVLSEDTASDFQRQFIESISHEEYPLTKIVESTGIHPEILYAYEGELYGGMTENIEQISLALDTPIMPICITVNPESGDNYILSAQYDDSLYTEKDMLTLLTCVRTMATTNRLLTEDEERQIIDLSAGEKLDYDSSKTYIDLFTEQARTIPDNIAVIDVDSQITYRELDEQSDIMAHWLITEHDIRPDDFVVVMLPRRKEFMISVLGIWKAGAAYVPIDLEHPEARKRFVIEDCEAKLVITKELLQTINLSGSVQHPGINRATLEGLAYMIYTSGSTGRPKGVVVKHKALMSFAAWRVDEFKQVMSMEKVYRRASYLNYCFDASIDDVVIPLAVGGEVHILSEDIRKDSFNLHQYLCRHRITCMSVPTQLGVSLVNNFPETPLKILMMGGEKMLPCNKTNIRISNGYGPTEFTVCSCFHRVNQGIDTEIIPIGRPVPNTWSFICDKYGNLVPQGIEGEICLVGPQMSEGYWKQPDKTAKSFVRCPFMEDKIMYRTGDLASYDDNGELVFSGRFDSQVKLRGFRIELGEIENAASRVPGVTSAVAVVKNEMLILYYTGDVGEDDLKTALAETLTEYMLPGVFIHLNAMPLTPNGKIDSKALPEPDMNDFEEYVAPRTLRETWLCNFIAKELGLERIGMTDSFRKHGMNSIKALKMISVIQKNGCSINMTGLLHVDTVKDLCQSIDEGVDMSEIGSWLMPYDASKQTIVLCCGLVKADIITSIIEDWQDRYNIYVLQPLFSSWPDIEEISYDELLTRYFNLMKRDLTVFACIMGFSFGGELAYHLSVRWNTATGQLPIVLVGDAMLTEISEEELDTYRLIDVFDKFYTEFVSGFLCHLDWLPIVAYKGRAVLISAIGDNIARGENELAWKAVKEDITILRINDTHVNIVEKKEYYSKYLDIIQSAG